MSLLDDVSIVVTPNGYKAGELYAVIPVPTDGAELLDCNNFDCAVPLDDWTVQDGWTISGNKANYAPNTGRTIYQTITTEIGKVYKISYEVSNWVANAVGAYVIESSDAATALYEGNEDGNFSRTFTATGVTAIIRFRTSSTSANLSIDNASVKEVITASADMDVTRATAATRVDENGLVNYAEIVGGDLITDGDFPTGTTAWTSSTGWTLGGGVAAWDGAATYTWIAQTIGYYVGKQVKVTFDAVINSGNLYLVVANGGATPSITTSDSYEFILTPTGGGAFDSQVRVYQTVANSDFTITNISVKEVTRDNVPRIDYTGGGCPHILAEPQRTNLFEYSESFNNIEWSRSSVTVVDNSSQSPDGTNNASLLYPSSSGDYRYLHNSTTDSTSIYTISAFVKASGKNVVWFYINSSSQIGFIYYDLSDGTTQVVPGSAGTPTATIVSYGNDWYKISYTSGNAFALGSGSGIGVSDAKGDPAVTANGTDGVLVWGLQLEAGSYPTSYIPTSGSTVTRNQDIFTRDGIGSLINSTEGVLFVEMAALSDDGTNRSITLSDGSTNNIIQILFSSVSNTIRFIIRVGGVGGGNLDKSTSTYTVTDFNKVALKWKQNDAQVWINGTQLGSPDTNSDVPTGLNDLSFEYLTVGNNFFGKVKQLQVYDTSLSDEQLLQLTGESGTDFFESYTEMAEALTYTIQ